VGCGGLAIDGNAPDGGEPRLIITPNPVWLEAQLTVRNIRRGSSVEIVDAAGRVIDALGMGASGAFRWYPPRDLPSGVYFARVRGDDAGTTRFVLIR
jgi:hypothetical protein